MSNRNRNILIVLGALVAVVAIAAFARRGDSDAQSVQTQKVAYAPFQVKLPESGIVQHPNMQTIPVLIAGNIHAIYASAGQAVSAGQLLATIDAPTLESTAAGSRADYESAADNINTAQIQEQNAKVQYQGQVETSNASLDLAQRVYDADVNLYNNRAIPRQQLDSDRAKLEQARVQYRQAANQLRLGAVSGYGMNSVSYAKAEAQKASITNNESQRQLSYTRIIAPFSGTIQTVATQTTDTLRTLQPGDAVTAGQALFTIASGNGFVVRTKVDEQDVAQVSKGQPVIVSGEDFNGKTFKGHVVAIAPTAQKSDDASSTSRQVLTTVALDQASPILRDGMTADVDILTTNLPHAITVANGAIVTKGKAKSVWVIRDGKAHGIAITTGQSNETVTVVTRGLSPGDIVITQTMGITEGKAVKIAPPKPSPSPSP